MYVCMWLYLVYMGLIMCIFYKKDWLLIGFSVIESFLLVFVWRLRFRSTDG